MTNENKSVETVVGIRLNSAGKRMITINLKLFCVALAIYSAVLLGGTETAKVLVQQFLPVSMETIE